MTKDSRSDYDKMNKDGKSKKGTTFLREEKPTVEEIRKGTAQPATSTGQSAQN